MKMKNLKKIISALLVVMLLTAVFPPGVIASASAVTSYRDVSGHWAAGSINRFNRLGFIDPDVFTGVNFRPDRHITRVEFFSLLVRALGATAKADVTSFNDLADQPAHIRDIVAIANQMGIAQGHTDGSMRPNSNLLRQEAATLAARAMGMSSVADWTLSKFHDGNFVSPYARTFVAAFVEKGLMIGYPDGTIRPGAFITRAEAVRILDNLFTHVYMPETGILNVYMQGALLVQTPGAELVDSVIDGDVIIGDGIGNGRVVLRNCTINGRLIVRGGGPNTVTVSNTSVSDGIYVASFGASTHISVTDNSTVPVVESVSSFNLSGSGVAALTILENARVGCVINLNGVNLDELNISGNNAQVMLNTGYAVNARFDEAGQNASLNLAQNTIVNHLTIQAPNAAVTGLGHIRNLTVNNSGAVVIPKPDFVTLGLNIIANVAGEAVSSMESQWTSSNIDRVSANSNLKVSLLPNTSTLAPFDQTVLTLNMVSGGTAAEAHVTQSASSRVPLTQRNNRWAYWVGFFVPAPPDSGNMASVTYTFSDGAPITIPPRALDNFNGRQGLLIYLPVTRDPGRETGIVKELLHINWGGHLTENLHFRSSTMHLAAMNQTQKDALQKDFDNRVMYSIQPGVTPYQGAEATRRILNSDNPLGLPVSDNKGLLAINRAVSNVEVRSILEDPAFAAELTVNTTGTSQYSALSGAGKTWVAEQVLAARKTLFSTPAAVKAAFDKAVQQRLALETTLLGNINSSVDFAALRRVIENSANAAILEFQTGSEPYRSFTNEQKNAMATYLWRLRPYKSIQEVIDAIRDYLGDPSKWGGEGGDGTDISGLVIRNIRATVRGTTVMAQNNTREITITVDTSSGQLTPEQIGNLISNGRISFEWTSSSPGVPQGTMARLLPPGAPGMPFTGPNIFNVRCTSSTPGTRDTLKFTIRDANDKIINSNSLSFSVEAVRPVTGLSIPTSPMRMLVGMEEQVVVTVNPPNANENIIWESDNPAIAEVIKVDERSAMVIARSSGKTVIRAMNETRTVFSNTRDVWVFKDEGEIIISPSEITLGEGSTFQITYEMYKPPVPGGSISLDFRSANAAKATVSSSGLIRAISGSVVSLPPPDLPEPNRTVIIAEVRISGVLKGSATVTVNIENRQSLLLEVEHAVMWQGDIQGLDVTRILDPVTNLPILPQLPGQQFIWDITGRAVQFVVNGQITSNERVTLSPNVMPQIRSTGIGRSTVSIRTSTGEQAIHTIEIVSVPRGVEDMKFFRGSVSTANEILRVGQYGRILEVTNAAVATPIVATERNDTGRRMTWTPYEVDQFYNISKLPRNHAGYNNWYYPDGAAKVSNAAQYAAYMQILDTESLVEQPSTLLTVPEGRVTPINNKTGLAAVRVSPIRDPDMEQDVLPGGVRFSWVNYWYGFVYLFEPTYDTSNPLIPVQNGTKINHNITEQSHLYLEARADKAVEGWTRVTGDYTQYFSGVRLETPSLDVRAGFEASLQGILGANIDGIAVLLDQNLEKLIAAGYVRVTDVNGKVLTFTNRTNPEVRAVVDMASFDNSNVLYVWVTPREVQVAQNTLPDLEIPWQNRWDAVDDGGTTIYKEKPINERVPYRFQFSALITPGSSDFRNDGNTWFNWPS